MVTNLQEFKAAKEASQKPLISRRRAGTAAGSLIVTLADCEPNDLIATMRFDMTPDDLTAIECFVRHLQQRISERVAQRSKPLLVPEKNSL